MVCWVIRAATIAVLFLFVPMSAQCQVPESQQLAVNAKDILTRNCYRCHGQNGSNEGSFNAVLVFPKLGGKVVPGDPKKSRLFKKMSNGTMPPEEEKPRPSDADIATIEKWIKAGAPAPVEKVVKPRPFIALVDELAAMQKYLRKADREDRKYIRFFSLRHLHNLTTEKVKDADLRIYRAALSKLINSLSRKKEIVVPDKADNAGALYAIDLRKLDWERKELWNEVLKLYPYGLRHDQYPDERKSRDLAEEVYELAGTKVPVVRADWFVATASRPPLYHTMLQLPKSAVDLERELGVKVAENIREGKVKRAGFNGSGVSGSNRLVERHDSTAGAYWKSYDFKTSTGRGNLFVFPLGPEFKGNPFPRNAFKHDGGEIIFNLPNGLQGYLLVDGKDNRIDAGPIEVVSDSTKISGTPLVVNGLSCMKCHAQGMLPFKDRVRGDTILGGDARDLVKRLYPEAAEIDKDVQRDRKRFLSALDEAAGPFLNVDPDAKKPIEDFPEPVSAIARWYIQQEITLEEAARELGLKDPKELQGAISANARLQELGLFPLAKGGTIKREVWESMAFKQSPFQEAARELKLGTPFTSF